MLKANGFPPLAADVTVSNTGPWISGFMISVVRLVVAGSRAASRCTSCGDMVGPLQHLADVNVPGGYLCAAVRTTCGSSRRGVCKLLQTYLGIGGIQGQGDDCTPRRKTLKNRHMPSGAEHLLVTS